MEALSGSDAVLLAHQQFHPERSQHHGRTDMDASHGLFQPFVRDAYHHELFGALLYCAGGSRVSIPLTARCLPCTEKACAVLRAAIVLTKQVDRVISFLGTIRWGYVSVFPHLIDHSRGATSERHIHRSASDIQVGFSAPWSLLAGTVCEARSGLARKVLAVPSTRVSVRLTHSPSFTSPF